MTATNSNPAEERFNTLAAEVATLKDTLSDMRTLILSGLQKVEGNFNVLKNDTAGIHKKIDALTRGVDTMSSRVEALDSSTSTGFDDVGGKIVSLSEEISKIGAVTGYAGQYDNMKGLN